MKKIPLTQGKFTIVDDCDYEFLMQWKWYYHKSRSEEQGYVAHRINKTKIIWMHRVILERMGHKDFVKSDHINRNKLNNRRCNLRPATSHQSSCNRNKRRDNTSGYIGVTWCKRYKKWYAYINRNRKHIHLGYYDDPKEAAKVYNKAALKYHGKFAVLNEV